MLALVAFNVAYDRSATKPWRCAPTRPDDWPDYEGFLKQLEAPHTDAVDAAVRNLLSTGQSQPLSDAEQFYLGLRVDVGIAFLSLLSTTPAVVPFPFQTEQQVLSWVLIDWWHQKGRMLACYTMDED